MEVIYVDKEFKFEYNNEEYNCLLVKQYDEGGYTGDIDVHIINKIKKKFLWFEYTTEVVLSWESLYDNNIISYKEYYKGLLRYKIKDIYKDYYEVDIISEHLIQIIDTYNNHKKLKHKDYIKYEQ